MRLLLQGILLFSVWTFIAGYDFHLGTTSHGHFAFVRLSRGEQEDTKIGKRSVSPRLAASERHRIRRRSAEQGDSCKTLQGDDTLKNNTHGYTFNDLSGSVSLAWVGDGTGVILALTTYQMPFFLFKFGQSRLYRSEDYGKTFEDVTSLINNTFITSDFGIAIGPENSGKVILTGEISGLEEPRIFASDDAGKSFSHHDLPFIPLSQIRFNPENSNVLLVFSIKKELWISEDFGSTWRKIHDLVCLLKWGRKSTIYFTTASTGSCSDRGTLELMKTTDYGKTIKSVASKVYSFGLGGRYLFVSVMNSKDRTRVLHVSIDQGETWNIAQLPAVGHDQFYSILAANDEIVFIHVDDPGDSLFGTIYVSDDRGTVYSKSLERHLYTTLGGDTDFTNITSLRGVFTTSILAEDKSIQTVVSFDQGGEWVPLRKPSNVKCKSTAWDPDKCNFRIHAAYSIAMKLDVPMPPVTEPNAVGLILAHGNVGDSVSDIQPDVYVSDDGGYTWIKALSGPHHYAILDSGGLLVAVEHSTTDTVKSINSAISYQWLNITGCPNRFSTDEGQCWRTYNFTEEPIFFTGLASEPGARSMNVSLWGYKDSFLSQNWVSFTIDFKDLLTRDCVDGDYVQWLAHSDDISDPNDGCILGYKERFLRLRKDSVCWNGRDYQVTTQPAPCLCTLDDFLCDFGYYRKENSSECVEQPDLQGKVLELCLHGHEEQLRTDGYRKIPGDKCEGGKMPERKEIDLSKRCVSDLVDADALISHPPSKSVGIIVTVVVVMLLSIAAGAVFVKKYVCGGRFLVHRYSVLQQHAEDTATDEMDDPLEINHTQNSKIEFHDDSDEDLLE